MKSLPIETAALAVAPLAHAADIDAGKARDAARGKEFADMLRNADWNHAVFSTARQLRRGANQAECPAGQMPLDKPSSTFTLGQPTAAAQVR